MSPQTLISLLEKSPQDILLSSSTASTLPKKSNDISAASLKSETLQSIKNALDPIASKYSIFNEVYLDGLDAEQIWAQVEMIIDGIEDKIVNEEVPELIQNGTVSAKSFAPVDLDSEMDSEMDSELDSQHSINSEEEESEDSEDSDQENSEEEPFVGFKDSDGEEIDMEKDDYVESDIDMDDLENDNEKSDEDEDKEVDGGQASELNDEFFNLDDFKSQIKALDKIADNQDIDEDEDIDYFGDLQDDDQGDGMDGLKYEDFFAPPKKYKFNKDTKRKQPPKKSKKNNKKEEQEEEEEFTGLNLDSNEQDYEQAMESVRKDLFASEDEDENEPTMSKKEILSTLEKQQREIQKQIERYEAENVGEKKWQVKGEVSAVQRPANSLLESHLDFERSSKPAPVITQEVTDSLEDLIRARILKNDFDDIPRRIPDTLPEFKPSKLADISESKSKKSLGELYEQDFLKQTDPEAFETQKNEQLDAAHQTIVDSFQALSRKLDALSAWHYAPKAPKPTLSIVAETAAISMEDAQPTALAQSSTLAPHEVYTPKQDSTQQQQQQEIIGPDGLPISKSEMSREDKQRLRRKLKAQKIKRYNKKQQELESKAYYNKTTTTSDEKNGHKNNNNRAEILKNLKRANVTVVDKKGQTRDVEGNLKTTKTLDPNQLKL